MEISVVTGPANDAATLDEVREHLRIDGHEDNEYITRLIAAATARVEAYTGRRLIEQTLDVYLQAWPCYANALELPVAPVTSVSEIVVQQTSGEITVAPEVYELLTFSGDAARPAILQLQRGQVWPAYDASRVLPIRVRVVAGYGAAATNVPEGLRQAIYTIVGGWYEARQDIVQGGPPGTYQSAMVSDGIMEQYRLAWAV